MKKKITRIGNSWAILLTKTMLELLEINPEKEQVNISFENKSMIIKKELSE